MQICINYVPTSYNFYIWSGAQSKTLLASWSGDDDKEVSLLLKKLRLNMCFLNSQLALECLLSTTSLDGSEKKLRPDLLLFYILTVQQGCD